MIAILGATGSIGGALARLLSDAGQSLAPFARDVRKLAVASWPANVKLCHLDEFAAYRFDTVINAIGAGDPGRVRELGVGILDVSERWDRYVLETMRATTQYVFLSSGAIYGACATAPDDRACLELPINHLGSVPPYTMAKLYVEARHRYHSERAILDLRVFSFAAVNIDYTHKFFLAELARSIANAAPFETGSGDFVRDYVGVEDIWRLIECWQKAGARNEALDVYSKAPVSKSELLEAARKRFGIPIRIVPHVGSPTGDKPVYASAYRAAARIGYEPHSTSLERVMSVLEEVAAADVRSGRAVSGARR